MINLKRLQVYNRLFITVFAFFLQVLPLFIFIFYFRRYAVIYYWTSLFFSILLIVIILNGKRNPAYKITWLICVLLFPIFGGLFYLIFGIDRGNRKLKTQMREIVSQMIKLLDAKDGCKEAIFSQSGVAGLQSTYIKRFAGYPPQYNDKSEYLTSGEIMFSRMVEELEKAEQFIFLEYFIIEEGMMWNTILDILRKKAEQGLDVRVIYDDVGCMKTLPLRYDKKLEQMGISCSIFHPLTPVLSTRLNHRDHRKITIIDGHTGFTGGINLADEYINKKKIFGHWKDTAVMLKGRAVWNMTVMFLSTWDYTNNIREDLSKYLPFKKEDEQWPVEADHRGFVQPFHDSPLDDEPVGESVFMNLIHNAQRAIDITTPYLIVSNEMLTALCLAAKSGVRVRIITPYIPDKWYVHTVTRSYYQTLIESGVSIYEYTPGFMHAKTCTVDEEYGFVGTINMDYRSLYLHFECGVWLYRTECIQTMISDFDQTIQVSRQITLESLQKTGRLKKMTMFILRIFAPLL